MSSHDIQPRPSHETDTAEIPWARTTTRPTASPHGDAATAAPQAVSAGPHPAEAAAHASVPALSPPHWSGRKTAIAAALAIGFSSIGAIGAAAVLPAGASQSDGPGGPGFPGGGQFPPGGRTGQQGIPGQQGQQNQLGPGGGGLPGGAVPGLPGDDAGAQSDDDGTATT